MRFSKISLVAFLFLACLPVSAQSLESIFTKGDKLVYQGYEITRFARPSADSWTITIKKNGKIQKRFEIGATMSKDWAKLGLFNFLGGRGKQLIVEGYSGGAHCCWEYKIIDLSPTYRVLYDSDDWNVGYDLNPVDLDKDGVFEFTQSVMTFDYFPLSHAYSAFPPAVFKYNHRAGKYLPANRLFQSRVTQGIEAKLTKIAEWNKRPGLEKRTSIIEPEYAATSLDVFLRYLYSGREKRAWDFFDKSYKLGDKQEIKFGIKRELRGCAIYKYLYR